MVDPGEHVSATVKREFSEEALAKYFDGSAADAEEAARVRERVDRLFTVRDIDA